MPKYSQKVIKLKKNLLTLDLFKYSNFVITKTECKLFLKNVHLPFPPLGYRVTIATAFLGLPWLNL